MVRPAPLASLAASLAACLAAAGAAGWIDALLVGRGAAPPVPWAESAEMAARDGALLAVPLLATAVLVRLIPALRRARREARAPGSALPAAAIAIAFWIAALGLLAAAGFSVKVGWVLGAVIVGCVAGCLASKVLRAVSRPGTSRGPARALAASGGLALLVWAPALVGTTSAPLPVGPAPGASVGPEAAALASSSRPNIVLIVVDALRADHVGCYGCSRPTTPNVDLLAASGVRFEEAVAPSSWTLPAMASILTSTYPGQHGTVEQGHVLPRSLEGLASTLREAGYETAAFTTNPWLKRAFGFDEGFEDYHDLDRLSLKRGLLGVRLKNFGLRWMRRIRLDPELVPEADEITRHALAWLAGGARRPFFLYLHYMDVHAPYDPVPPFHGAFCRGHAFDLPDHLLESRFRLGKYRDDAAVLEHVIELYDEDVLATDHALGALAGGIEALGLRGSTAIFLTADHGEEFYDHGDVTHGRSLYQEVVRVPLIVAPPGGRAAGVVSRRRVSTLDLHPTILDLAGIETPEGIEGVSLAPQITSGTEGAPRPIGSQLFRQGRSWAALYAGSDKIIRKGPPASDPAGRSEVSLFHLESDPRERSNAAAAEPDLAARLASALESFEKVWGIAGKGGRRPGEEVDPETLKQLKALGYLD